MPGLGRGRAWPCWPERVLIHSKPPPVCLPLWQAGAVELESAELRFNTDAQGQPTTVTVKQVRLRHATGTPML